MTEILEALKSIVCGLEMQTESEQVKWLTKNQLAEGDKSQSWRKDNGKEKLDISLFLKLDSKTLIEYSCYIQHDHVVSNSWLCIENENLQGGRISINQNSLPELKGLEDILYKKYINPILKSYKLGYQDDINTLINIVNKCGIQAARDYKINAVIGQDNKSIFKKIFGK